MRQRAEGHFYGKRKVVYVQISEPAHRGEAQKHLTVYGKSVAQVKKAVDKGLADAFGKTSAGHPRVKPNGKKKRSRRKVGKRK